jgi:signal transduction histidine kinase
MSIEVPVRLPAALEVATYRIVAEGVTNAVKHSGAQCVRVQVTASRTCVVVDVYDDGAGSAAPIDEGVGLVSMRERAVEVGGVFVLDSPSGHGTRVRAELPLDAGVRR